LKHVIHAGSAGFPSPGYGVAVVNEQGEQLPADTPGILAVDISQSPIKRVAGYKESRKAPGGPHHPPPPPPP
ncbi:AMP-binding protein, partial [Acinetobacter calcoaceticus]